jgi:hypothetical protein
MQRLYGITPRTVGEYTLRELAALRVDARAVEEREQAALESEVY